MAEGFTSTVVGGQGAVHYGILLRASEGDDVAENQGSNSAGMLENSADAYPSGQDGRSHSPDLDIQKHKSIENLRNWQDGKPDKSKGNTRALKVYFKPLGINEGNPLEYLQVGIDTPISTLKKELEKWLERKKKLKIPAIWQTWCLDNQNLPDTATFRSILVKENSVVQMFHYERD